MKCTLKLVAALAVTALASAAHADIVTTTGNTGTAPVYNRLLEDLSAVSAVGTAVRYNTFDFSVSSSGTYTFMSTAKFDNFTFLYSPSINPAAPLINARAGDDDLLGLTTSGFAYTLVAGVNYTFVNTGFSNSDFGAFSSTIGGPGTISAAAPPVPAAPIPGIVTYTGNTTSAATFNRPVADLLGLSAVGTNVRYDSYGFRVDTSGSYSFLSTAMFDNTVFLYSPTLNPVQALAGAKAANDDLLGFTTAGFTFDLVAGVDYEFITTGFANTDFGMFSNTIAGPGAFVTTAIPEPETYALMLVGLGLLGAVRRRSQLARR